jgi:hypothetical protein
VYFKLQRWRLSWPPNEEKEYESLFIERQKLVFFMFPKKKANNFLNALWLVSSYMEVQGGEKPRPTIPQCT